jgi:PPOX class probable F420-dependent enzyme
VEAETMRRRVAEARVGRLATVTPESRPHLVPCCFALSPRYAASGGDAGDAGDLRQGGDPAGEGDVLYSAVDAKPKTTLALRRLANLRANGAAALLVDHYDDDWDTLWWVRVDGRGRVVEAGSERERALDLLAAKYEQYRRRRPAGAVVAIDVTRWRAWP